MAKIDNTSRYSGVGNAVATLFKVFARRAAPRTPDPEETIVTVRRVTLERPKATRTLRPEPPKPPRRTLAIGPDAPRPMVRGSTVVALRGALEQSHNLFRDDFVN